ncbi:PTS system, ascorbate-specific IIA component [Enterococcus sp. DIV2402]|uniref:Ascorbate-specific PTS system EIIA component n=1 Tax=Candidatus Enterococcus lowellii TaxID=2230877 RepID=A0ABZ2SP42_9ENTE|nr:PTS sugar transporter subunit IIA [Enterococcus sp. DIV2402]MBO0463781.1 PTS sugar transporter subunit IIA [Enterococcus sp. DIV2402]
MLRYFYDNQLIKIMDKQPKNWEEAIRFSGEILKEHHLITDQYIEDIIRDCHEYGPYIVIIPDVAMPHSSAESSGVLGTGIGFTIMQKRVSFEEGNPEKDAKLFFTLAAKDADSHMKNIANLSELLMMEDMVPDLLTIETLRDFERIMEKHGM